MEGDRIKAEDDLDQTAMAMVHPKVLDEFRRPYSLEDLDFVDRVRSVQNAVMPHLRPASSG